MFLGSDCIVHTLAGHRGTQALVGPETQALIADLETAGWTIGGSTLFPSNRIAGKMTINSARGTSGRIQDRFDLTLESIRRYYAGREASPLSEVLARHGSFFELFGDFDGYVDFFLLNDLVDDRRAIRFWSPFHGFDRSPLPSTHAEYAAYLTALSGFVAARSARVLAYVKSATR